MSTILAPLPATDTPLFQALLTELPDDVASAFGATASALGPLLEAAPYLLDLARTHGEWLAQALDAGVRVLTLSGNGRAFMAGGDLAAFRRAELEREQAEGYR